MFGICGMDHLQIRLAEHPVEFVAALSARKPDEFKNMAYSMDDGGGQYMLAGHPIKKQYLQITSSRICPECIKGTGYIPARWDLINSEVCHIHGKHLVDTCHSCSKKLKWLRPGLLTCNCGADLSDLCGAPAADGLIDLAHAFSAVIDHYILPDSDSVTGMPFSAMTAMSLQALAGIVHSLGARRMKLAGNANSIKGGIDPKNEIREAADIFSDWPKRFFDYLDRDAAAARDNETSFWKRHRSTFTILFKMNYPKQEVSFLKQALLEYARSRAIEVYVDQRLLEGFEDEFENAFGDSMVSLAKKIGVRPITLKRRIERGTIDVTIQAGNRKIMMLNTEVSDGYLKNDIGDIKQRDLPKFVGLPVSAMKELRKTGVYQALHRTTTEKSWAIPDLDIFRDRILSKCISQIAADDGLITIQNVMRMVFWSEDAKAEVIRAIDDGRIMAFGPAASIPEIRVRCADMSALTDECRYRETGLYQLNEVVRLLSCSVTTIIGLINSDILEVKSDGGGIRKLVKKQVDAFHAQFIPLAVACKEFRSNSCKAHDICLKNGITVHEIDVSGRGYPSYISRNDLDWYRKLMTN